MLPRVIVEKQAQKLTLAGLPVPPLLAGGACCSPVVLCMHQSNFPHGNGPGRPARKSSASPWPTADAKLCLLSAMVEMKDVKCPECYECRQNKAVAPPVPANFARLGSRSTSFKLLTSRRGSGCSLGVADKRYVLANLRSFVPFNLDEVDTRHKTNLHHLLVFLEVGRSTASSVQSSFESYPGPIPLRGKRLLPVRMVKQSFKYVFIPAEMCEKQFEKCAFAVNCLWIVQISFFDTDLSPCKSWRRAMKTTTVL